MIVKNESAVIKRALDSVRPIIDYWIICDTGSTDDTPAIILQNLHDIPGELHRAEWVNFGHNRTQAIQLAKDKADYTLVLDADMIANIHQPFKHLLTADYYNIRYEGSVDYTQPMLVSNQHNWTYVGVTHEYLYAPTTNGGSHLPALTLTHFGDGGMRADKFIRDEKLLLKELEKDPSNVRNLFYLAQTYRDTQQFEEALHWYKKRIAAGEGWAEEYWYTLYQIGQMQQALGYEWEIVLASYLRAYEKRPTRLEPIYQIVKYYREHEAYVLGHLYSSVISYAMLYPQDQLFIDKPVYDYLLLLEHGVCCHGTGRIQEAQEVFEVLLEKEELPPWVKQATHRGYALCNGVTSSH